MDQITPIGTTNNGKIDLLAGYLTDVGILQTRSLTCMRIVGRFQLVEGVQASSAAYVEVALGIAWVQSTIPAANLRPWETGTREVEWLQVGVAGGMETGTTPVADRVLNLQNGSGEQAQWDVDIKQMRKQPTPNHELVLVYSTNGKQENLTVGLQQQVGIMLALP